jgi:DNA polymerase-1
MIEQYITNAEELGYTETLFGRRRYVPEINSHDPGTRASAERAAYNFPLQGTAADLLKKAMIELSSALAEKHPKARMVLTVHDELVVEAQEEDASAVAKLMREVMEGVYALDVPLVVDVGVGKNWRDVEKV